MGSSPSKSDGSKASGVAAGLGYAKLLKRLELKNYEVARLKRRVKELESALKNYKKMVHKSGITPNAPSQWDDKSMTSWTSESGSSTGSDESNVDDLLRKPSAPTSTAPKTLMKPVIPPSGVIPARQGYPGFEDFVEISPGIAKNITSTHGNLPSVGDHVVSMWGSSKWQYFTATIEGFDPSTLKYTIQWDDNDPTGRVVDYYNLALDRVPADDQVGVGSKVLFHQGEYRSQEVHGVTRSGGFRWHQGEITKISKLGDGTKRYEGKHAKAERDGKWIAFKDYSETFHDYKIDDFRMPPNVFDILDTVTNAQPASNVQDNDDYIDVFVSYANVNSLAAIKNREVERTDLPPRYEEAMLEHLCDPRDIVEYLKSVGIRVHCVDRNQGNDALLETASMLKKTRVFIACLSDEYASDDTCRMEFQYAKKTLRLPVIPLVVGTGSFQWKMTVVGLLIAGELYIHFKDRAVQGFKMNELLRAIKRHIPELQLTNVQHQVTGYATLSDMFITPGLTMTGNQMETAKPDIFFSYCWSNSYQAKEISQTSKLTGSQWSDPRTIAEKLASATNSVTWIDIKRLESAADGMGMFDQIATAINDCKVFVACVSEEFSGSDNCRMELQFAATSLSKPIIILIVGEGDKWKETVVGKVAMLGKASIDLRQLQDEKELEDKIVEMKNEIFKLDEFKDVEQKQVRVEKKATAKKKKMTLSGGKQSGSGVFKAPVPGDHVVSLHQDWAYFMATVVEFDPSDLVYTVDWDDGDSSGRVQSYKDVALDVVPDSSEVGVGSIVLFPQGSYGVTQGNNTGGQRYHQGKITDMRETDDGTRVYDGVHTKDKDDGKWINWGGYHYEFRGIKIEDLRISPNAMDALFACKQAFNLQN